MSAPIEPVADNVVLQQEKISNVTASGFYLPESAQEKPKIAKVLAIGSEVKNFKVGERVVYKEGYDNDTFKFDGEEYILIKEENIRGKLK